MTNVREGPSDVKRTSIVVDARRQRATRHWKGCGMLERVHNSPTSRCRVSDEMEYPGPYWPVVNHTCIREVA